MDDLIDGTKIDGDCPECSKVVQVKVGRLWRSPTLICPRGHSFTVDRSQFNGGLRPVYRAIRKLNDKLDNLGARA